MESFGSTMRSVLACSFNGVPVTMCRNEQSAFGTTHDEARSNATEQPAPQRLRRVPLAACQPVYAWSLGSFRLLILPDPKTGPAMD